MMRRTLLAGIATALTFLAQGRGAQAVTLNGTQDIAALGRTTSDTGDINTAKVFSFTNLVTTDNNSGDFASPNSSAGITIGTGKFDITGATPVLTFQDGNGFGQFTATSFTQQPSGSNGEFYFITGTFTASDTGPLAGFTAGPATIALNFTQNGGLGGAIGTSIVLASAGQITPADTVPEPASVAMLGLGLVGVVGLGRLRRKAA